LFIKTNIILNIFELYAYNSCNDNTWKETGKYIYETYKDNCCCCCSDICESSSSNYSSSKTSPVNNNTDNNTNTISNNKTITTITTENYIINLKNYVSIENYKYLKEYVEKGKKILIALIEFYKEMEFEGFKTKENISNEIISIIVIVAKYTKDKGDNIAKICLESTDDDAKWLLLYYLFPLIISVIKLKIEKGIYKKSFYVVTTNQINTLTTLERRIETDVNGNIHQTFRIQQQIYQTNLVKIIS